MRLGSSSFMSAETTNRLPPVVTTGSRAGTSRPKPDVTAGEDGFVTEKEIRMDLAEKAAENELQENARRYEKIKDILYGNDQSSKALDVWTVLMHGVNVDSLDSLIDAALQETSRDA